MEKETITQEISIPEGCVLDEEKSTLLHLVFKKQEKKCWEDLGNEVSGGFVTLSGVVSQWSYKPEYESSWWMRQFSGKGLALSEKDAICMRALAQITQLMPHYGGNVTEKEWRDTTQQKWEIWYDLYTQNFYIANCRMYRQSPNVMVFHTKGQGEDFLKSNEQLVRDYLMLN